MSDDVTLGDLDEILEGLEERQLELNDYADELERRATAAAFRDENGYELADDDGSNLADVAAIDGHDDEDAGRKEDIDDMLKAVGMRVRGCDEDTAQTELRDVAAALDAVRSELDARADGLGLTGDLATRTGRGNRDSAI